MKLKLENYIKDPKVELVNLVASLTDGNQDLILNIFDILKLYKMDSNSFIASAFFIAKNKAELDYEQIKQEYGEDVYSILKKLNEVGINSNETNLEYVRNMFISMAKDLRVIIIFLAYNLYRAEHIYEISGHEQVVFARMIRDIYAPLSARLGLREIKNKLEDIIFKYFDPDMYTQLSKDDRLNKKERQVQISKTIEKIKVGLKELSIDGGVYGREKHLASVYNKLKEKKTTLSQIYDLMAVRVIVNTVEECYMVLGKINSSFTIIPNRFKDYIAMPKINGYRSIHTGILAENNRPIEVQIRTKEMHQFNEYGVAAHWIYKDKNHKHASTDATISWLKNMIDENKDLSSKEFVETISRDMFKDEIFAQTPNGKIIKFPSGANCIDFAYAIHTDIGNRCVGAKINGKIVPIITELSNGDVVEIVLGATNKGPSRDWLNIVQTNGARSKINAYFKKQFVEENIKNGKITLENNLKTLGYQLADFSSSKNIEKVLSRYNLDEIEELYALIGNGSVKCENIINKVIQPKSHEPRQVKYVKENKKKKNTILVGKQAGMLTNFAKCCMPASHDEIIGYLSTGRGVMIHRKDCANVQFLNHAKLIEVEWDNSIKDEYSVRLRVEFVSDASISKIVQILEKCKVKLMSIDVAPNNKNIINIVIVVNNAEEIQDVQAKIKTIKNIKYCKRI